MEMEPDPKQTVDRDLVDASRRGDRNTYAVLIRRHTGRVFAVCLGILGGIADSEDITQETFMKGLSSIHTLRDDERFSSWITQIARNLCRDFLKTNKRRRELLNRRSAEGQRSGAEFSDLHAAMEKLSEKDRIPLALYYFDGRDITSVAEELGITEAAAYTRLSRARRALRIMIEDGGSK